MKRKTVGQEAYDRMINPDENQGIIDTQREVHKSYLKEINNTIDKHKDWKDPFYVVVIAKKERIMENVIRQYFMARKTLPTPQWDQTVWRFEPAGGDLRFLWCTPDENTAKWMAGNTSEVPPEQYELLRTVLDVLNQKLYNRYHAMYETNDDHNLKTMEPEKKKVELILP
jgi:hypothetical protein